MSKLSQFLILLLLILSDFLLDDPPLFGQEFPGSEPAMDEQVKALDRKVRDLEKRLDTMVPEHAGKRGFVLRSADGDHVLKFKAVLQFDGFYFTQDHQAPGTSSFTPRKVRSYFEGTVAKYYDFRFLPDFGNGQTVLQDAYLDFHYWPLFSLKAGKYKSPVGLERLQEETNLVFFDRALPTNLVPNRDVGWVLHGDPWEGAVSYAVGIFNGVADGAILDTDTNNDKEGAARIFVLPFKKSGIESLNDLGIGIGGTYGNQQTAGPLSPNLPFYKTIGQQTIFSYTSTGAGTTTVVADGKHVRYVPQVYYYWGPFGLLGEYALSSQEVTKGTNSTTLTHTAWQVAVSFLLTGEKASYRGVYPIHPFDPRNGDQWGAFEFKFRFSQLDIDPNAFPTYADPAKSWSTAREWGGGVNWYLNRNIKVQLDYFDTGFDPAPGGVDRSDEKVVLSRFQLVF